MPTLQAYANNRIAAPQESAPRGPANTRRARELWLRLSQVKPSAVQRAAVTAIINRSLPVLEELQGEIRASHEELACLDPASAEHPQNVARLSHEIGVRSGEIALITANMKSDIWRVFTPPQQQSLGGLPITFECQCP